MRRSSEKLLLTMMLTICMLFSNTARASAMEQSIEAPEAQAGEAEQGAEDAAPEAQAGEAEQGAEDAAPEAQAGEAELGAEDATPEAEAEPAEENVAPEAESVSVSDETSEEDAENSAGNPAEDSTGSQAEASIENHAGDPIENTAENPTEENTEETTEETTENPTEDTAESPTEESPEVPDHPETQENGEGGNILAGVEAIQQELTEDFVNGLLEAHYLAFASDLHGQADTLENAMEGFPADTEYVSIIGDLVGERGGDAPEYRAEDVYERIQGIFEEIKKEQVSIIWADHDAGVINQDDIVKCEGGYTSGQIYEGKNSDGSTAYYIYAIGFYDMLKGGMISQTAANQFKEWIRDKDETIPTLVLCHAPLVAKRGDNFGATYWNEALNFAATGVEGISTDQDSAEIIRNVIYLCGHNHTVDQTEYVFPAGSSMNVQIDASIVTSTSTGEGETSSSESSSETHHTHHKHEAQGVLSNIFYNSLVPGYLKTSGNATLMSITEDLINLTKYNTGQEVSLGTDGASGEILPSSMEIKRIRWGEPGYVWADDLSSVTASRSGINTTALYQTETAVTVYEVIRAATCAEDGLATYTASFTNPAFEQQIRTLILPATGGKDGIGCDDKEQVPSTCTDTKSSSAASKSSSSASKSSSAAAKSSSAASKSSSAATKPVPTGDEASAALWICLALAAGVGLVITKKSGAVASC